VIQVALIAIFLILALPLLLVEGLLKWLETRREDEQRRLREQKSREDELRSERERKEAEIAREREWQETRTRREKEINERRQQAPNYLQEMGFSEHESSVLIHLANTNEYAQYLRRSPELLVIHLVGRLLSGEWEFKVLGNDERNHMAGVIGGLSPDGKANLQETLRVLGFK
jgi:hypothetical protein